jgi:hypothetical protein
VNFIPATFWFSTKRINDNRKDHRYIYGPSSRQHYLAIKITSHSWGYKCSINLIKHEFDVRNGSIKTEFQPHKQHSKPINTICVPDTEHSKPINTICVPDTEHSKPINTIYLPDTEHSKPINTIWLPDTEDSKRISRTW